MTRTLFAVLVTFLGACASGPSPALLARAQEPLTCANKAACDLFWQRAQVWVGTHCAYRIAIASDALVQTYGPMGLSPNLAFQVMREANADGSARIRISANCDNAFGCNPDPLEAVIAFKNYVRAGS